MKKKEETRSFSKALDEERNYNHYKEGAPRGLESGTNQKVRDIATHGNKEQQLNQIGWLGMKGSNSMRLTGWP